MLSILTFTAVVIPHPCFSPLTRVLVLNWADGSELCSQASWSGRPLKLFPCLKCGNSFVPSVVYKWTGTHCDEDCVFEFLSLSLYEYFPIFRFVLPLNCLRTSATDVKHTEWRVLEWDTEKRWKGRLYLRGILTPHAHIISFTWYYDIGIGLVDRVPRWCSYCLDSPYRPYTRSLFHMAYMNMIL